jgi:hypothetical protein
MTGSLFQRTPLQQAFADLRRDLIDENGPRISTMRNYRFAIVQYDPVQEYKVRAETQRLSSELSANGWSVIPIDLHRLLMARVRAQGDDWAERVMEMERRLAATDPARGLNYLMQKLTPLVEGPDGIAADCSRIVIERAEAHPHRPRRLALPILPLVGPAAPSRRPHQKRARGAAVPRRAPRLDRALVHGRPRARPRLPPPDLPLTRDR